MKTSTALKCLSTLIAAGFVASASATPLYGADKLLGSANLSNSGDGTELTEFQKYANITSIDKSDNNVTATRDPNDANYWYIDLGTATPGYFLLKFGTGPSDVANTFFFQNLTDFTKLSFSVTDVNGLISGNGCAGNGGSNTSCNIGRLSHYATGGDSGGGGGNGGQVPEPGSLALLGLGFAGMALRMRSRNK